MMRYAWGGVGMLGGWLGSALMALLLCALVVLAIVVVIRMMRSAGTHAGMQNYSDTAQASAASGESSALRILDERFARGEIDEEEYKKKKELLTR